MSARVDGLVRADSMPLLVDLILSCDSVVERVEEWQVFADAAIAPKAGSKPRLK